MMDYIYEKLKIIRSILYSSNFLVFTMALGKVQKGIKCSVIDCNSEAVRSLSRNKFSILDLKSKEERRVYLCEHHYKVWKKETKKLREIDRLRYG